MPKNLIVVLGGSDYCRPFRHIAEITQSAKRVFEDPKNVWLVVFTGGEDVHPSLYGGMDCGLSYTNLSRDSYELAIFNQCRQFGIKMVGICRGFQFLNVASGGQMYQHLDNHAIAGRHTAYFPDSGETMQVSSTHHQLVKLPKDSTQIAWSAPKRSKIYYGPDGSPRDYVDKEIEGAFFYRTNAMGVQYHPEMMLPSEDGHRKFLAILADFLTLPNNQMQSKYKGVENDIRRAERVVEAGG